MSKRKSKSKTLFLIDDEPFWLSTMAKALEESYSVVTAESGATALDKLASVTPDLILSDVKMPDMNGFDLYDKIKTHPNLKKVPFVFMSSLDDYDVKQAAKSLGVTDYIIKPYDIEDTKQIIFDLLKKYKNL